MRDPPDAERHDNFYLAESVAIDGQGNTAVAGADGDTFATAIEKDATGSWVVPEKLDGGLEDGSDTEVEDVGVVPNRSVTGTYDDSGTVSRGNVEGFNPEDGSKVYDILRSDDDGHGRSVEIHEKDLDTNLVAASITDQDKNVDSWDVTEGDRVYVTAETAGSIDKIGAVTSDHEGDFGASVALNDNWLVVGGPNEHRSKNGEKGLVVIYRITSSGLDHEVTFTQNSGDGLGADVEITHVTDPKTLEKTSFIVAGAPKAANGGTERGLAYVYRFDETDGAWIQEDVLKPTDSLVEAFPDPQDGAHFGAGVAIEGDVIVAGEPDRDHDVDGDGTKEVDAGMVHVFEGVTEITQQEELISKSGENTRAGDHFGEDVAVDKHTLIVGAPGNDFEGFKDLGTAHIFK